jgi:hypothetical protein
MVELTVLTGRLGQLQVSFNTVHSRAHAVAAGKALGLC